MTIDKDMFIYTLDLQKVCNLYNNEGTSPKNVVSRVRANEIPEITFRLPYDNPNIGYVVNGNLLEYDGQIYEIINPSKKHDESGTKAIDISCRHYCWSLKGKQIVEIDSDPLLPVDAIKAILYDGNTPKYGWVIDTVLMPSIYRSFAIKERTAFDSLNQIAELYNAYFIFSATILNGVLTSTVSMYSNADYGSLEVLRIDVNKNLKNIGVSYDTSEMITRLYAFGGTNPTTQLDIDLLDADNNGVPYGLTYIEDYSYFTDQGYTIEYVLAHPNIFLKEDTWRDSNYVDPDTLLADAIKRLGTLCKPKVVLNFTSIDEGDAYYGFQSARIGTPVIVNDEDIGVSIQCTLTGVTRNFNTPWNYEFEISNIIEYNNFLSKLLGVTNQVGLALNNNGTIKPEVIEVVLQPIKNDITLITGDVANIQTIFTNKLVADYIDAGDITADLVDVTGLIADNAFITNLTASDAFLTNLTASNAFVTKLTANDAFITTLITDQTFSTTLSTDTGFVNKLIANEAFVGSLGADTIFTNTLSANTAFIDAIVAQVGTFDEIDAGIITTGYLSAARIEFGSLDGDVITARTITADRLEIGTITAISAVIADAAITNAKIDRASINKLVVTTADIENLAVTTAKIANLAVTNAQINDLNATKINAGFISADRIATNTITANKLASDVGSSLDISSNTSITIRATKDYVASRGENLVTNGTGLLGDNTNFSTFTFDKSDVYGSVGSFADTLTSTRRIDEFMPVNPDLAYKLNFYAKQIKGLQSNPLHLQYVFVDMYDVDKNVITNNNYAYYSGTLTSFSQPVNNGDTKIYLNSLINWQEAPSLNRCSLIFWDYANSGGYVYPENTYSRNITNTSVWNVGSSAFNLIENSITLATPWNYGYKGTGTKLSQGKQGGGYCYIAMIGAQVPEIWTKYSGVMDGQITNGVETGGKFRPATAFIKLGWLNHYSAGQNAPSLSTYNKILYSNISFGLDNITANQIISSINVSPESITIAANKISILGTTNISDAAITSAKIGDLQVTTGKIALLAVDTAQIKNVAITTAKIANLAVTNAQINDLNATKINAGYIAAARIEVGSLGASVINTTTINAAFSNAVASTINTAFITDALVTSLNAGKINAGLIKTNLVSIVSGDSAETSKLTLINEAVIVSDGVQQRVVLGKYMVGATPNYGLVVRGADGTTVLFDNNGVTNAGVVDGAINNAKVATNANIAGSKLDINSVVSSVNGATTQLLASKIQLDTEAQTLEVAFNSLKSTVTTNGNTTTTQGTALSVVQGQIASKVWQTDIDIANSSDLLTLHSMTNLILNGDFSDGTTDWIPLFCSFSTANGVLSATADGTQAFGIVIQNSPIINAGGHKIYLVGKSKSTNAVTYNHSFGIQAIGGTFLNVEQSTPLLNTQYRTSQVFDIPAEENGMVQVKISHQYLDSTTASGKVMEIQQVLAIDLTIEFGEGKEPTKEEMDTALSLLPDGWFEGTHTGLDDKFDTSVGQLLDTRISVAESAIVQNATSITLSATKSEVETLTGRVTAAESSLTVSAGKISLIVTGTNPSNYAVDGEQLINAVNSYSGLVEISASRINLTGAVTLSTLDSNLSANFGLEDGITKIDGANIITGSIKANIIDVKGLTVNRVDGGVTTTTLTIGNDGSISMMGTISSSNYSATSGWKIMETGDAFLNQATIRGSLILPTAGATNVDTAGGEAIRFYAGSTYEDRANAKFKVFEDGSVIATKGTFEGTFTGKITLGDIIIDDSTPTVAGNASIKFMNGATAVVNISAEGSYFTSPFYIGTVADKRFSVEGNSAIIKTNSLKITPANLTSDKDVMFANSNSDKIIKFANNKYNIDIVNDELLFNSNASPTGYNFKFVDDDASSMVKMLIDGSLELNNYLGFGKLKIKKSTTVGNVGIDFSFD